MLLLVLLLPLYNFFIGLICSKHIGAKGLIYIFIFNLALGLFFVILLFSLILGVNGFFVYSSPLIWLKVGNFTVTWSLLVDSITVSMLFVVYLISFLVHIYSISYMKYDPQFIRFFCLLSLFTFFMLLLVMSYNFIELFLGWEGVGLCSYLLINFWFTRVQANKAAIKAMLVNRIGDSFLLLAIAVIFSIFKTTDFIYMFTMMDFFQGHHFFLFGYSFHSFTVISFLLFFAAMGKSAQLGLHTWLPDAMEGPTPVSALIHAATMVTAGVFLLIRLNGFFEFAFSYVSIFVATVGALTALFGSIVAIVQNDIKKIVAYSTCSQLGYMFVACGLFRFDIALFHLFNHAFFKALLFLSAGLLIYMYSDEQDIRRMGGLNKLLSYIYVMMFFGSYALMGLPFFSGYYSKELILEVCFATYTSFGFWIYLILLIAAFCTSVYSTRLLYLVFFDSPKGFYVYYKNIKEYDVLMSFVLFVLFFFSLFSGFFFKDVFVGFGSDFLRLIHHFRVFVDEYYNYEFIDIVYKHIPLFVNVLGILFYFLSLYLMKTNLNNSLYKFLVNKWYFDYLYNYFFVKKTLYLSFILYKDLDKNYFEIFGPYLFNKVFRSLSILFDYFTFVSLFQLIFVFIFMSSGFYILYFYISNGFFFQILVLVVNYFIYMVIYSYFKANNK